jgi:hypothetical protein
VQLVLGVEQGGNFRFFVNTEEAIASPVADEAMMKGRGMKATGSKKK